MLKSDDISKAAKNCDLTLRMKYSKLGQVAFVCCGGNYLREEKLSWNFLIASILAALRETKLVYDLSAWQSMNASVLLSTVTDITRPQII